MANAERTNIEETLTNLLSSHVSFARPDVHHVRFEWTGAEVQQAPLADLTPERLYELAERVLAVVLERLRLAQRGQALEICAEGVGKVFVSLDAPSDRRSIGIEGYGHRCRNAVRLAKQIHGAAAQLDRSVPGVVVLGAAPLVVEADHAAAHVRELLASVGGEMDHVAGAIVLGASAEWITEQTIPVANPHARVSLDALPLPQAKAPTRWARFEDFGDLFTWPE